MADPNDLTRAREALTTTPRRVDASLLGAVRDGLLSVPVAPERTPREHDDDAPRLAVRRSTGF
ncbi:MAG: hypothetical protein H5T83_05720 [Actinotalea sp.]|nr:hypothetical protein [Actinotalea sp.]